MRIGGSVSRSAYYDRNGGKVSRANYLAAGAAASALTTRWSYTTPAGKKAFMEFLSALTFNDSVTAMNGLAQGVVQVTPSGGVVVGLVGGLLITGQASAQNTGTVGASAAMFAGDVLEGTSNVVNNAPGTNVAVYTSALLTEFDA